MKKHESRLELERKSSYLNGFVEGLNGTKEIALREIKEAINSNEIVISKGESVLFDIIESIGKIDK